METTLADLDALTARLETELGVLTDEQLDRPQEGDRWTARETIGHVTLTVRLYDQKLRGLIARRPQGTEASDKPHKPNWFARMLLKFMPNVAKKFKAPKVFDPRRSKERFTVEGLIDAHRALRATGAELARLNLGGVKFSTPVSSFLRMKAADAIPVQVEHGKRHLGQILRAAGVG